MDVNDSINELTQGHHLASKFLVIITILIVCLILTKLLSKVMNRWERSTLKKMKKRNQTDITAVETKIVMAKRIILSGMYLFAFILILLQFDALRSIGAGLLASAGIAGIIIGMASQTTLSNIIAGISISFAQPIRLKDAVIFEGDFGWIEDISLMHTTIRTWDNRRIVAPNNVLVNRVIQNWTVRDPSLLGVVMIFVDYTCDVNKIRHWVEDIVNASHNTTKEKVAVTHVVDFTEKSMQLRILARGPDAPTTWELRCEIREKLIKKFKEEKLPLPMFRLDQHPWEMSSAHQPAPSS